MPQVVPIHPFSDGDATHRPPPSYTLSDSNVYLEKLAALWMENRGEAVPGANYILDRLPNGYTLFEKPRLNNPKHVDKHLYGHPKRRYFDSANRYFPHFLHLMETGSNMDCPCTVCRSTGAPLPMGGGHSPKTKAEPKLMETSKVDEEGTLDVYRKLLDKLRREGKLDQPIREDSSPDWRAERALLPGHLETLSKRPSWIPRAGELILFVRKLDGELFFDEPGVAYRIIDPVTTTFIGYPHWEAGVVGQVAEEEVQLEDLVTDRPKKYALNVSGFRVEPLSQPNSAEKSYSTQYKYLPLHCIRPFNFWTECMKGVAEHDWHPTVKYALTVMSSFSLLEKYRFKGSWPNATIFCKGIYIGAELLLVGDAVRLTPTKPNKNVTDILLIESIYLRLSNLDTASDNDTDEGHPYNSAVHIKGKAFTLDAKRAYKSAPISREETYDMIPRGLHPYGKWFVLHDPVQSWLVPYNRIIGRCYDAEAMLLWFRSAKSNASKDPTSKDPASKVPALKHSAPDIGFGLDSVRKGRTFSQKHYKKISQYPGKSWYWADCRTDALDLETLNGQDVARCDIERDPSRLRRNLKIIDGVAGAGEQSAMQRSAESKRLAAARHLNTSSSLVQSALQGDESESEADGRESRKRSLDLTGFMDVDEQDMATDDDGVDATAEQVLHEFMQRNLSREDDDVVMVDAREDNGSVDELSSPNQATKKTKVQVLV